MVKRKASEWGVDLNLSLGVELRKDDQMQQGLQDDENILSLSLYTDPSYSKFKKLKEDESTKIAGGTSTLDLTL